MDFLFVLGRIILGGYFLNGAYDHIFKSAGLVGYAKSKKVSSAKTAVIGSGVLLLLGGLSILFGVNTNMGIALLILFLIPVSFTMHAFWNEKDPMAKMSDKVGFMKNMALIGALLMLLSIATPWVNSFS